MSQSPEDICKGSQCGVNNKPRGAVTITGPPAGDSEAKGINDAGKANPPGLRETGAGQHLSPPEDRETMTEQAQAQQGQQHAPDNPQGGNGLTMVQRDTLPYHKLANVDLVAVLDRIANGERPAHIAKELGASKAALHYRLAQHPDYPRVREIGMEITLDQGLDLMEEAAGAGDLNLVRAREAQLRRIEWRAEREHPGRWGQRTHQTVEHVGDLGDRLRQARERVVDSTSQRIRDVMLTTQAQPEPTHGGVQSSEDAGSTDGRGTL